MRRLFDDISSCLNSQNLSESLTRLFCHHLFWGRPSSPQRHVSVPAPVNQTLTLHPVAQLSGLPVFRIDWQSEKLPTLGQRRAVYRGLSQTAVEHLVCYVTQDRRQIAFTWARRRLDGKVEMRTLPYEVGSRARTTIERLSELAFSFDELGPTGEPPITVVIDKLNRAFDVQKVTEDFFRDYTKVFEELQRILLAEIRKSRKDLADGFSEQASFQQRDKVWAHDYALQFLNRLMFLYFIQRKGWLEGNSRFIADFWRDYKTSNQPKDSFFDRWLSILFFEAFNNKIHGGHRHFPEPILDALFKAPYLNGGLFSRNDLDEQAYGLSLPDEFFTMLFDNFEGSSPGFFERYNFTIVESAPLDVEVAVDPEMIGKVYESLVNISSGEAAQEDRRGSAGIFYTSRTEIELMCRLALVDALANRLGNEKRPLLYDVVFAIDEEEKCKADEMITSHNLWQQLNEHLRELTICDPACGSGSFLVGMLLVLDDLQARANAQLGIEETAYQRRRRIIGEQLYGVDVMDWAVHIAELRLWLQLVIETELESAELHFRPLLPNLSFKIRCGDSLVQEVGGINFGLHRSQVEIPSHLKGRITQLKGKKLRFYQGGSDLRESELKAEELAIFRDVLTEKQISVQKEIAKLRQELESPDRQLGLAGILVEDADNVERRKFDEQLRNQIAELQSELERIEQAREALSQTKSVPFVWDIAFVEIFEGENGGFDIVIGNPPYVRQEMIAPPNLDPADFGGENSELWKEQKKIYKEKLQKSVAAAWRRFFRYNPNKNEFRKLDGKSDLYIYFYFHGLSLLNKNGSFCFITSNSWLDVGYGADLQEFLLRHSHIKFILDNEKKRSFAQADVNTVIVLLGAADDRFETIGDVGTKSTTMLRNVRFVMFKVPFEEVMNAETFKKLEQVETQRDVSERWRITVRPQHELFEEGLVQEDDDATDARRKSKTFHIARYEANKWGGKYLRAPDIFFTILEKGKGKLVRLGDIAEVRRGFTTGANEFFYLDDKKIQEWGIEEEFLKPFLFSLKEIKSYEVSPKQLERKIFVCREPKESLAKRGAYGALRYIQNGEKLAYHQRPSVRGRSLWYALPEQKSPHFVSNRFLGERFGFPYLEEVLVCDVFFIGSFFEEKDKLVGTALLNSTISYLAAEITARKTYGIGVAYLYGPEIRNLLMLNPTELGNVKRAEIENAFQEMRGRLIFKIDEETTKPDRRELDDVVFDVLGLTASEREAVYEAVVNLVRARLEKARSV